MKYQEHREYEACWAITRDSVLFRNIAVLLGNREFTIIKEKKEYRRFVRFFDTSEYDLARRNCTLREVRKPEKNDVRYDYKTGHGDSRVERQYHSDKKLSPQELAEIFEIPLTYRPNKPVMEISGEHTKTFFSRNSSGTELVIELKQDTLYGEGQMVIRDIELEYKKGLLEEFHELISEVESGLQLRDSRQSLQKYTRIALKKKRIDLDSLVLEIA